jgi:nitric oxide dioxygenase
MITLKSKKEKNNTFVLKEKIRETNDVLTLKFSPLKGSVFSFRPGQFVLFSFLDNRANGKIRAYSISSCPQDKFLALTVKKLGVFSSALHKLKVGEKIKISPPQGNFFPEESMENLVFLAGGIGITPFYSIIKDWARRNLLSQNKITLFYSNRTKREIVFFRELNKIADQRPNFKTIYLLTREKSRDEKIREFSRLNIKTIKKYLKILKGKYFFICGPIEFVNDLWKGLKKAGVKEDSIKTEVFY